MAALRSTSNFLSPSGSNVLMSFCLSFVAFMVDLARRVDDVKLHLCHLVHRAFANLRASPALLEAPARLQICVQRHHRLEGLQWGTRVIFELLRQIEGSCRSSSKHFLGQQDPAAVRSAVTQMPAVKVGYLDPHRNGLMSIRGSAVVWKRLMDKGLGLLRAMADLSCSFIGLPACRVFETL